MSYENIDAVLTQAALNNIRQAVKDIYQNIPTLVNLSDAERQERLVLGDKSVAFAQKVVDYTKSHPQFMPGDVSIADLQRDFAYYENMRVILQLLRPLVAAVEDTELAVGTETYYEVLAYYNNSRAASERNSPGARAVYADLKEKYPKLSSGRPPQEADAPAE